MTSNIFFSLGMDVDVDGGLYLSLIFFNVDIEVQIYEYIYVSTANFFRVLYFHQIAELSNIFQNQTGGMIFLKIVANLTVLEGNFYRDFFCKI